MAEKRPALGKGLRALIPEAPERQGPGPTEVAISLLHPNKQQPRLSMDSDGLDELAASIRKNGVIQPILVRRVGASYQIIAGERRWRASQRAGLETVPIIVRDVPEDGQLLELALIENIQRENLNPLDEALAYQRLHEEFGLTHDQVASAVGKDRSTIANSIRILRLPDSVRVHLATGVLSPGHARALLALSRPETQTQVAGDIVAKTLSVRQAEALVRRLNAEAGPATSGGEPAVPDVHTKAAEEKLRFALGTRVRIVRRGERGRIEIDFGSEAELIRLYEHLTARG